MKRGFVLDDTKDSTDRLFSSVKTEDLDFFEKQIPPMKAGRTFDDGELNEKDEKEVFFKNTDMDDDSFLETDEDTDKEIHISFWSSPVLWILVLTGLLAGIEAASMAISVFEQHGLLRDIFSLVFILLLVIIIVQSGKEIISVWRIADTHKNRLKYNEILTNGNFSKAAELCDAMTNSDCPNELYRDFKRSLQPHFSAKEVFDLYERIVLRHLDKKAKDVIIRRSIETSIFVAVSPLAMLDMALAGLKMMRMVREISEIYGFKPSFWAKIKLYKTVAKNVIFIGLSDLLLDLSVQLATNASTSAAAKLLEKAGTSFGVGVSVGFYSTRVGYMTVRAVRPIDLSENSREIFSLGKLRTALFKYVAGKISSAMLHGGSDKKK
ncbi:MAG: DUF697 domain-containing protein [Succinivibrio sp.]|jgi:uncharacterized protein (TIGR01620 family)|nr:DUF697 domain-containing protein [Succinivibrio sp.]